MNIFELQMELNDTRNSILDKAHMNGFKHTDVLIQYLSEQSAAMKNQELYTLKGLLMLLVELEQDMTMQRDTLLDTLNKVKREKFFNRRIYYTLEQICCVTLAIAHVRQRDALYESSRMWKSYGRNKRWS